MMACDDVMAALGDYLEGELGQELRRHIQEHLAQCRTCQLLYDSTTKTVRIVTESGSFELPPTVSEPIVQKVMAGVRVCARAGRQDNPH